MTMFTPSAVLVIFGLSPVFAQYTINPEQAWGDVRDGMRMAISTSDRTIHHDSAFYIAFQNVGSKDSVLNLGIMLSNGEVSEPSAVLLTLTDSAGHDTGLSCQKLSVIVGRPHDFIVALPAGATYVLKLKLGECQSPIFPTLKLKAGRYRIAARFEGKEAQYNLDTPGLRLLNFWKGVLKSNSQEFDLAAGG